MGPSENVSWFADITLESRAAVGGKGGSLGELTRAGIAVPPGFVVCTAAFERFIGRFGGALVGYDRGFRRRKFCRIAGYVFVGDGRGGRFEARALVLGESLFGAVDRVSAQA